MIIVTSDMFSVTHISVACDETDLVPFKLIDYVARDYKVIYVCGSTSHYKI